MDKEDSSFKAFKEKMNKKITEPPNYIHYAMREFPMPDKEEYTFKVIANPYARHDMDWNSYGSGLCSAYVVKPDGTVYKCGETQDYILHGGPRYLNLPKEEK